MTSNSDFDYTHQIIRALVVLNTDLLTKGNDYEISDGKQGGVAIKFAFPLKKGDIVKVLRPRAYDFECHKLEIKQDGLLNVDLSCWQWG